MPLQLAQIGTNPSGLIDGRGDVAVEIAIGALRLAEGPMDIKPEPTPFMHLRKRP